MSCGDADADGAQPTAEEVFNEQVEQARTTYRRAIAKRLSDATRVEILLLSFDGVVKPNPFGEEAAVFPLTPKRGRTKILDRRDLKPEESKLLLTEMAKLLERPEHSGGALCHFPIHGLRVYVDETPVYSGSFCWLCGNFGFEYPEGDEWLDTSKELAAIFNKLMPVPKSEIERFRSKYPSKSNDED